MNSRQMNSAHHHFSNDDSSRGILVYINPVPLPLSSSFIPYPPHYRTSIHSASPSTAFRSTWSWANPSHLNHIHTIFAIPIYHALHFILIIFCFEPQRNTVPHCLALQPHVLWTRYPLAERACQQKVNYGLQWTSLKEILLLWDSRIRANQSLEIRSFLTCSSTVLYQSRVITFSIIFFWWQSPTKPPLASATVSPALYRPGQISNNLQRPCT